MSLQEVFSRVGTNLHEAWQTGTQLVCQGFNHVANTAAGKKVTEVTSPVFVWVKDKTPESFKNKSFAYGAGVTFGLISVNHWRHNTMNHRLEQAARLAEGQGNYAGAANIRALRV
ncbi:MAG: hypothetical protein KDK64_03050 [Chlamydiia bacterium]|nr:hypothetical protein [Chlamydiia bacterium]